jgi:hypothetical protein
VLLVDITDCDNPVTLDFVASGSGNQGCLRECLPAGTYALVALPANPDGSGIFDGIPCSSDATEYVLTLTCDTTCLPGACCNCLGGCMDGVTEDACESVPGGTLLENADINMATTCAMDGGDCLDLAHGCAGAIPIMCDSTTMVDLTMQDNLQSEGYSCYAGTPGVDIPTGTAWYSFVATDDTATVQTCRSVGSGRDSVVALYEGGCCAAVPLA